jgi:hypothetical protein
MAWGDTGGGYTWGGIQGGKDRYSKIIPTNREARKKRLLQEPYGHLGGGRSPMDAAQGRSWQGVTTPRFAQQTFGGDQGRGGQGNVYRPSGVHPGRTGITATDPGQEFTMRTGIGAAEDEKDKRREFDHRWYEHMRLPSMEIFGKVGDLAKGAMRGSRLHSSYKDAAVEAGLSKAQGSKAWERDKRSMMTGYGKEGNPMTGRGEPGYEDSDQAFYDKYMALADMAQDNEKAQEYRDTAETAWRNKQTSDRLAAASGFEGYMPDKYRQPGIGLDRMNEIAANLGQNMWYPGEGSPRSLAEGQDAIASQMNVPDSGFAQGYEGNEYDLENQIKLLENQTFPDEDITSDLGGYDYSDPDEYLGGMYPDRLHPNPALRFGNLGINDPANEGFPLDIADRYTPYRDEDYFDIDRTAGYGWAGDASDYALRKRGQ